MIRKDKNGFIDIIKEHGLEATLFQVSDEIRDELSSFVIKLKSTRLEFWIRNKNESYFEYDCNYTPFSPSYNPVGYCPINNWFHNIQDVYEIFSYWLSNDVKTYIEEQNEVDLWEALMNEDSAFQWKNINEDDIDFFSEEQRKYLLGKIKEFRVRLIDEYSPNHQQLIEIDRKLNYLTEAIERLNKFDWKSLLFSTLMGIITTMSLDKGSGETLVNLARQIFSEGLLLLK